MAYTTMNFKTKKQLKEAVARGDQVRVFSPNGWTPTKTDGIEYVEGPHFPEPHRWYAQVTVKDGNVTSVK